MHQYPLIALGHKLYCIQNAYFSPVYQTCIMQHMSQRRPLSFSEPLVCTYVFMGHQIYQCPKWFDKIIDKIKGIELIVMMYTECRMTANSYDCYCDCTSYNSISII